MAYEQGWEHDQDVSKKLTRAAFWLAYDQCEATFTPYEKIYTEFELRQAIFAGLTDPDMPYAWTRGYDEFFPTSLNIEFKYGVPKTTYYQKIRDFKSTLLDETGKREQNQKEKTRNVESAREAREEKRQAQKVTNKNDSDLFFELVLKSIRDDKFASETAPWHSASLPLLKGYYLSSLTDDDKKEVNENFSVSRKNLIDVFSQNPIQSIILRRGEQALACSETKEEVQRKIAKAKEEKIEKAAAAAAAAAAQKSKKNAVSMDVPESSTPRAAQVFELPPREALVSDFPPINSGQKKGGDVSTEKKRKFPSASSSSVAAESSTCSLPSLGKNTREHSAVREGKPYGKNYFPRTGRKHTGRG